MRRKLDGGIELPCTRTRRARVLNECKTDITEACGSRSAPERLCRALGIGQQIGAIDQQQRPAGDADVARIPKRRQKILEEALLVLWRIALRDQELAVAAVPASRPIFVGPANAEGKIRLSARDDL